MNVSNAELSKKLEGLRDDFEQVRGYPFKYFYCPILHVDEDTPLCLGHILTGATHVSNRTLPQRQDVDNFFGTAFEAEFVRAIQDREKTVGEIWIDPKLHKFHRPTAQIDGVDIPHYFGPKAPGSNHVSVQMQSNSTETVCDFNIKLSHCSIDELQSKSFNISVNRDYTSHSILACIKSAYLSLFCMLGYQFVFSASGLYLSSTLKQLFEAYQPRKPNRDDIESLMVRCRTPVYPIFNMPEGDQGTLATGLVHLFYRSSGGVFAFGTIVKNQDSYFCVLAPSSDQVDTFLSFIQEPPPSVAVRPAFFKKDNDRGGVWEIAPGDPVRVPLPHSSEGIKAREAYYLSKHDAKNSRMNDSATDHTIEALSKDNQV